MNLISVQNEADQDFNQVASRTAWTAVWELKLDLYSGVGNRSRSYLGSLETISLENMRATSAAGQLLLMPKSQGTNPSAWHHQLCQNCPNYEAAVMRLALRAIM